MPTKPLKQISDLIDQIEVKIDAGQATPRYVDSVQQKLNDISAPEGETSSRYYQYALELQALIYDAEGKEEDKVRSLEAAVEQAGSPRKLRSHLLKTYVRKHASEEDAATVPNIQKGPGNFSSLTPSEQKFMRVYGLDNTPEVGFFVRKPLTFFILLLISGGYYGSIYWFYKNWQALRDDTGSHFSPFWRTVFGIFYVWPLFKAMALLAKSRGYQVKYPAGLLAAGYIFTPVIAFIVYLYSNSFLLVTALEVVTSCISLALMVLAQQPAIFAVSKQPSTKPVYPPTNFVEYLFVLIGFFILLTTVSAHVQQLNQPYYSGLNQIQQNSQNKQ